jgi:hypothetical protein
MENAKKMIIISPEDLQRMQNQPIKSSGRHAVSDTVSELDREMLNLLNDKNLSDQDKWNQYQQVLQRYLHFASQKRKPIQLPVVDLIPPNKHNLLSPDELIDTFTKTYKGDVKNLLRHISRRHDKIDWDDNGTLYIDGMAVQNSNIIDLLHDIIRARKATQPPGWKQLINALKDISTPNEFITNPFARNYFERLKGIISPAERRVSPIRESQTPKEDIKTPVTTTPRTSKREPKWERFRL